MPRFIAVRRLAASALVLVAGCSEWRPAPVAPVRLDSRSATVRVTDSLGRHTVLNHAWIEGDTVLRGVEARGQSRQLPIGEIQTLEVRRASTGKTVALVGGVVAALAVSAAIASAEVSNQLEGMFGR